MDIKLRSLKLALARGELARVDAARGALIHCREGLLWVTQHGDLKDYLLDPGQSIRINSDGPVLVHAVRAATVAITQPPASNERLLETWWNPLSRSVSRRRASL